MSHIVWFYGRTRKEHNSLSLVVSWCLMARYVLGLQARNSDTRQSYVRPLIYRVKRKWDIVYCTPISVNQQQGLVKFYLSIPIPWLVLIAAPYIF